jgi:hypothetical protein
MTGTLNYIKCPTSPSAGCVVCWDGSTWVAGTAAGGGGGGSSSTLSGTSSGKSSSVIGSTILSNNSLNSSDFASILGGSGNYLENSCLSVIGGGFLNKIFISAGSLIGGGCRNQITGSCNSIVVGGICNCIDGETVFCDMAILNGCSNLMRNAIRSTIIGGYCNYSFNAYDSVIAGGVCNFQICAPGGARVTRESAIVGGSCNCQIKTNNSFIGGGYGNLQTGSFATSTLSSMFTCMHGGNYSSLLNSCRSCVYSSWGATIIGSDNYLSGVRNSAIIGSGITGCQSNTIYLNKESVYSDTIFFYDIYGGGSTCLIGPIEVGGPFKNEPSLLEVNAIGSVFYINNSDGISRSLKSYKKFTRIWNPRDDAGSTLVGGCVMATYQEDANWGIPAGSTSTDGIFLTVDGARNLYLSVYYRPYYIAPNINTSYGKFTFKISILD